MANKIHVIPTECNQNLVGLRTTRRHWQVAWFLNEHFNAGLCRIKDWNSLSENETGEGGTNVQPQEAVTAWGARPSRIAEIAVVRQPSPLERVKVGKRVDAKDAATTEKVAFTCYQWVSERQLPLAFLLKNSSPSGYLSAALRDRCDYILIYSKAAPLPAPGDLATQVQRQQYFEFAAAIPGGENRWNVQLPKFF